MRSLRPLATFVATTAVLVGGALVVPHPAAAERFAHSGDCVTVTDPPPGTSGAFGISDGPGGVWFSHGGTIDRVTNRGIEEFEVPDPGANTGTLAYRPGGPVWFADRANGRIGSVDRHGRITTYDVRPAPDAAAAPQGIVIGPRSELWFTDQLGNTVNRFDQRTGNVTRYPVPTPNSQPLGLVRGRDGALWFTERAAAKVGRLAPDGTFREWPLAAGAFPNRITVGPDGAIWFTELNAGRLGRIDESGTLTEFAIAGGPVGIASGPGRALYVSLFNDGAVARVGTDGQVTALWHLPGDAKPVQLAVIDGDIWTADPTNDLVYRVRPAVRSDDPRRDGRAPPGGAGRGRRAGRSGMLGGVGRVRQRRVDRCPRAGGCRPQDSDHPEDDLRRRFDREAHHRHRRNPARTGREAPAGRHARRSSRSVPGVGDQCDRRRSSPPAQRDR